MDRNLNQLHPPVNNENSGDAPRSVDTVTRSHPSPIVENKSIIDVALAYAAAGWPVFPCRVFDKKPLTAPDRDAAGNKIEGSGGFHKATTDPTIITEWWSTWRNALIATPTGR